MPDIKKSAVEFLNLVVAGKIDEAYQKYVDMSGRHHNVFFPAGFTSLKKAMEENHKQFPDKKLAVKNIIGGGDMVVVHSHLTLNPGMEMSVVHIFRFNEGRIIEMWDCVQQIPEDLPNKDGAF